MDDKTFADSSGGRMLVSNDEKFGEVVIGMPSPEAAVALSIARQDGYADGVAAERARIVEALRREKSMFRSVTGIAEDIEAGLL